MEKLPGWIFLLVGIFLFLPLVGVTVLNTVSAWVAAIGFILIGFLKLISK